VPIEAESSTIITIERLERRLASFTFRRFSWLTGNTFTGSGLAQIKHAEILLFSPAAQSSLQVRQSRAPRGSCPRLASLHSRQS